MCIILQEDASGFPEGANGRLWHGVRSVETLAFNRADKRVSILFLLLIENDRPGSYLRVLHPGSSRCELVEPWDGDVIGTLPYHRDGGEEEEDGRPSVLQQVYERMFHYVPEEGKLYQVEALNPHESWYGLEVKRRVKIWPQEDECLWTDAEKRQGGIQVVDGPDRPDEFVPFTTWKLGPFKEAGLTLLSFSIAFDRRNYDVLVGDREYFSVDGPMRLRSKIKRDCIPLMPPETQKRWYKSLEFFNTWIAFQGNYDIMIRTTPEADGSYVEVDECGSCMVVEAAEDRQPQPGSCARRYVTIDEDFKLNLCFTRGRSKRTKGTCIVGRPAHRS